MEVGNAIEVGLKEIGEGLKRREGPSVNVSRNKDGNVSAVSVMAPTPPCGAPSSVSMSVGKDGKINVTARDGFINPEPFGTNGPQEPTKSQLEWLKSSIQSSKDLTDAEKANFCAQIDKLMEHAPESRKKLPEPGFPIDSNGGIRKALQHEIHHPTIETHFPDQKAKRK